MPATPSDRQGSENADPQQEREANGILKQTQRQSLLHLAFQRYEEKQRELDTAQRRVTTQGHDLEVTVSEGEDEGEGNVNVGVRVRVSALASARGW